MDLIIGTRKAATTPPGETVIIQVHSRVNDTDIQDDSRMEKPARMPTKEAILACNRCNGRTEHEGKDNGRVSDGIAARKGQLKV